MESIKGSGSIAIVALSDLQHGVDYSPEKSRCESLWRTTKTAHFVK
jgi:hypothetical protein